MKHIRERTILKHIEEIQGGKKLLEELLTIIDMLDEELTSINDKKCKHI